MATIIKTGGGYSVGYDDGYSAGNSAGYSSGYNAGYGARSMLVLDFATSAGHGGTSSVLDTGNTNSKTIYYLLVAANSGYSANRGGSLQGSNDNSNWTTITSAYANKTNSYNSSSNVNSYRYFRFVADSDGLSHFFVGKMTVLKG